MSLGRRLPFPEAYDFAQRVSEALAPVVQRSKCVGSVRRQRPDVGDLEFVIEPVMNGDLFGGQTPVLEPIKAELLKLGTWAKGGERMMVVTDLLGIPGLQLDVFLAYPGAAAWGSTVAIRTGPADLGKLCVILMRETSRVRHDNGRAQSLDTGEPVPTETEGDFFRLAGVPCVVPWERDALCARLWDDYRRTGSDRRKG